MKTRGWRRLFGVSKLRRMLLPSDAAEEGVWVWTSGERANFTNWSTAQPDNAKHRSQEGENCAGLDTFIDSPGYWEVPRKWNDSPCNDRKGAICELILWCCWAPSENQHFTLLVNHYWFSQFFKTAVLTMGMDILIMTMVKHYSSILRCYFDG